MLNKDIYWWWGIHVHVHVSTYDESAPKSCWVLGNWLSSSSSSVANGDPTTPWTCSAPSSPWAAASGVAGCCSGVPSGVAECCRGEPSPIDSNQTLSNTPCGWTSVNSDLVRPHCCCWRPLMKSPKTPQSAHINTTIRELCTALINFICHIYHLLLHIKRIVDYLGS